MRKVLIVHDEIGYVLLTLEGEPTPYQPVGVPFIVADIPDGKKITGVDVSVTPAVPILEDIPKSETALLQEENLTLKMAVAELAEAQEQQKLDTQLALAELAESLMGGV